MQTASPHQDVDEDAGNVFIYRSLKFDRQSQMLTIFYEQKNTPKIDFMFSCSAILSRHLMHIGWFGRLSSLFISLILCQYLVEKAFWDRFLLLIYDWDLFIDSLLVYQIYSKILKQILQKSKTNQTQEHSIVRWRR